MHSDSARGGIRLHDGSAQAVKAIESVLARYELNRVVKLIPSLIEGNCSLDVTLLPEIARQWMPDHDTTNVASHLNLDTLGSMENLEKEILLALLVSPVRVEFPCIEELLSCIYIRRNIVTSSRKTELNFATMAAERPADYWCEDDERGFTVRPGISLISALEMATQPALSGALYSFSCYRATEYVILLGIAKELSVCNPALLSQLQTQCQTRVIRSGQFHEVFLHEYGSQDSPLPTLYYVPGDRIWFRNPDEPSSDVIGFEGSWVIYQGSGLFTNFWQRDRPYTLQRKCLEIYHWRHGTSRNAEGDLVMDEGVVAQRMADTLLDEDKTRKILQQMMRWRDPKGVYGEGGCIDTTREGPRWVCPGTADLVLPAG